MGVRLGWEASARDDDAETEMVMRAAGKADNGLLSGKSVGLQNPGSPYGGAGLTADPIDDGLIAPDQDLPCNLDPLALSFQNAIEAMSANNSTSYLYQFVDNAKQPEFPITYQFVDNAKQPEFPITLTSADLTAALTVRAGGQDFFMAGGAGAEGRIRGYAGDDMLASPGAESLAPDTTPDPWEWGFL